MVSDLKTFAHKGCKIATTEKVFFRYYLIFFLLHSYVFWPPLPEVQCPKFFNFQNPLGKVIKEVVSDWNFFAHKWCKITAQEMDFFWRILPY